jgi:hypothetical protein
MYLSIIITGVLTSIGVVIGVLEAIFLETNIFFKIKSNYPGFLPFDKHFSGFQYTYNYTAYLIIAALGLIGLLKNNNNLHKIFVFLFLFTLLLTQSKVSYLYIALLMVFSFKVNFFKDCRYLLAIALSLGYLLLAHLTFKLHGSDLNLSYYLREEKFMLFDVKAYSTLFLWLKEEFFQYIFTFNLNEISMSGYQANTEGTEPHSLLLSSYLFGGTIFSFLILYRLLMNFVNFLHNSHTYNAFFISSVLTILIESIIWDAYDSPIFWLIILLCPFFNKFMEERSKLYD